MQKTSSSRTHLAVLLLVLAAGLVVRIVALTQLTVVNPDGILYINQAKAIAAGQWSMLTHCQLPYISLYPFIISWYHAIIPDWLLSAQLVSLTFGMALLLVLYRLCRCFFDQFISCITVLMLAWTPLLVRMSVSAVRDSTSWFFYVAALLAFFQHYDTADDEKPFSWWLVVSCILVLIASWCRIESLIMIPALVIALIFSGKGHRALNIAAFTAPLLVLLCCLLAVTVFKGSHVLELLRLDDVMDALSEPWRNYVLLRSQLHELAADNGLSLLGNFVHYAYHLVWLMPFSVIATNTSESFFSPFLPLYMLGCIEMVRSGVRQRTLPVWMLAGFGFVVLYAHILQTWIMTYRFVALLLLPGVIIAGFGLRRCWIWLHDRLGRRMALILLVVYLAFPLNKDVSPIEADKAVYPAIARQVRMVSAQPVVFVAGLDTVAHHWVEFYVTKDDNIPRCSGFTDIAPASMRELMSVLEQRHTHFLLWEQNAWQKRPFGHDPAEFLPQFVEVGRWYHPNTGALILFRLQNGSTTVPLPLEKNACGGDVHSAHEVGTCE